MCICLHTHMWVPLETRESIGSSWATVTEGCETPDKGAEKWTLALRKNSKHTPWFWATFPAPGAGIFSILDVTWL